MANALIPDYLGQQVISGIRSLHRNQDNCIVLGKPLGRLQKLLLSNAIREYIPIHGGFEKAEQIIEKIIETCQSNPIDYLIPFGIASYYCISKYQDKLSSVVPSMVPNFSQFQLANDKLKTAEFFIQTVIPVTNGKMDSIKESSGAAVTISEASFGGL